MLTVDLIRALVPPRLSRAVGYAAPLALFALFLLAWQQAIPVGFAVLAGAAVLGAALLLVSPALTAVGLGSMTNENALALIALLATAVLIHPALTPWVLGAVALLHAVQPVLERARAAERRADADPVGFDAPLPIPAADDASGSAAETDGPQVPLGEDPFGPYPESNAEAGVPNASAPAGSGRA